MCGGNSGHVSGLIHGEGVFYALAGAADAHYFHLLSFRVPFCLSFQYTFKYDNDDVQIAYCVPYTYTDLLDFLKEQSSLEYVKASNILREEKLCSSLSGVEVPMLTITDYNDKTIDILKRKAAIISGRIHPGEANGSWMMHGLIQFLLSNKPEAVELRKKYLARGPRPSFSSSSCSLSASSTPAVSQQHSRRLRAFIEAQGVGGRTLPRRGACRPGRALNSYFDCAWRRHERVVIKVVPMINPDGVILGNYRTGLAGRDLNREFRNTDKMLFPTVHALKELVRSMKTIYNNRLLIFLDLHGHSVKKNVFAYGPEYPIFDINYFKCRLMPKLLSTSTEMFRYYACIFKITAQKRNTARSIIFNQFEIVNCFTIEASNGSYYVHSEHATHDFIAEEWVRMGQIIGQDMHTYIEQIYHYEQMIQERLEQKRLKKEQQRQQQELQIQKIKLSQNKCSLEPADKDKDQAADAIQGKRANAKHSLLSSSNQPALPSQPKQNSAKLKRSSNYLEEKVYAKNAPVTKTSLNSFPAAGGNALNTSHSQIRNENTQASKMEDTPTPQNGANSSSPNNSNNNINTSKNQEDLSENPANLDNQEEIPPRKSHFQKSPNIRASQQEEQP